MYKKDGKGARVGGEGLNINLIKRTCNIKSTDISMLFLFVCQASVNVIRKLRSEHGVTHTQSLVFFFCILIFCYSCGQTEGQLLQNWLTPFFFLALTFLESNQSIFSQLIFKNGWQAGKQESNSRTIISSRRTRSFFFLLSLFGSGFSSTLNIASSLPLSSSAAS